MTASRILRRRWRHFLFEPAPPASLGFCRSLFFGALLLTYLSKDFSAWARVADVFWAPIRLFQWLRLPMPSVDLLNGIQWIWKVSLFLGAIGLFTRSSTALATLLGTYLLGMQHSFGKIHHTDAALVLSMATLALSRCGDGWSVDRLLRVARTRSTGRLPSSGEYTWPVRTVWLIIACVYFAAGVSKLRHSGLAWVFSDNFARILIQSNNTVVFLAEHPWTDWGLWLAGMPRLCRVLAAGSLAIELSVPLALVSRRARAVIVPALFVLQVGVAMLMGPDFMRFLICYLFWIPWAPLGARAKGWMRDRNKLVFIFDGDCGLCQRTVAVLRALDVLDRIVFYDAIRDWPTIRERFPVLHPQECIETVHVVTSRGQVEAGFEAYRALSWSVPLLWLAAPFLYVPGVPWFARRIYAAVAERRHRAGCPIVPSRS